MTTITTMDGHVRAQRTDEGRALCFCGKCGSRVTRRCMYAGEKVDGMRQKGGDCAGGGERGERMKPGRELNGGIVGLPLGSLQKKVLALLVGESELWEAWSRQVTVTLYWISAMNLSCISVLSWRCHYCHLLDHATTSSWCCDL